MIGLDGMNQIMRFRIEGQQQDEGRGVAGGVNKGTRSCESCGGAAAAAGAS